MTTEIYIAVVGAVAVGIFGVLVRYLFISKSECKELRKSCQDLQCKKLDHSEKLQKITTDNLALSERDILQTLKEIHKAISDINMVLAGLGSSFKMFMNNMNQNKK